MPKNEDSRGPDLLNLEIRIKGQDRNEIDISMVFAKIFANVYII